MQATQTVNAGSSAGGVSRRLSAQDATFYYLETPEAPMNIGSVAIFEGQIPYRRFLESIRSRMHLIPRYRQRVVESPFNVGRPTWQFDPAFDIRRHIMRVPVPAPGTDEQLRKLTTGLIVDSWIAASRYGNCTSSRVWKASAPRWCQRSITAWSMACPALSCSTVMLDVSADPLPIIPTATEPVPDLPPQGRLFFEALFDSISETLIARPTFS